MKFKSLDELVRYVISESVDFEKTDITLSIDENETIPVAEVEKIEAPIKENFIAKIASFYDSPSVSATLAEENILFVDKVAGNRDICGSGTVSVLGREIMSNLCESDGTAYVRLSIDIDGRILENVLFKLQASDTAVEHMVHIRKEILDE